MSTLTHRLIYESLQTLCDPSSPQLCRKDQRKPYTRAESEEKFITNLEVKSNLETRAFIHSKVPGMKYRMLCTYLFLADISYVEREIKKKKKYVFSHMLLCLRGGEIPRNSILKKVSWQQELLGDWRMSTPPRVQQCLSGNVSGCARIVLAYVCCPTLKILVIALLTLKCVPV